MSPLHDGAVIIYGNRIEAARCLLPVSSSKRLGAQFGTRHRAAVGLTEETGRISVAEQGVIVSGLTPEELHHRLSEVLSDQTVPAGGFTQPKK